MRARTRGAPAGAPRTCPCSSGAFSRTVEDQEDHVGYTLGVDLGTTYTAAAVARDGRAEVIRLGNRVPQSPSAVFVAPGGEVLVGEAAERRGLVEPASLAREF